MKKLTKKNLIDFEEEIANFFNQAKIKAPVHLYYGNENNIIKTFSQIKNKDWVFCSWRSHYQCLLKGVPKKEITKQILAKAAQSATSVSVETGYITDETKEQILQKADAHAKGVASKAKDYTPA